MKRRTFLRGTLNASVAAAAVGAGLLTPRKVLALAWPQTAFHARTVDDALKALFESDRMDASEKVALQAPDIAENGAVVPVTVSTRIAGAKSLSILVPNNPTALACTWDMGSSTEGFVSTRIKMGKTSKVVAVVKAGDRLYSTSKDVKVTIGGCGG